MIEGYVHPDFAGAVEAFGKQYEGGAGGSALAITHRGEPVVDVWLGTADPAGQRPWRSDTLAMSFSTTKGVASTALHVLADRGALAYDQPVADHWPEFAANGKAGVTVRDLMTHRAGLHRCRGLVDDVYDLLDHRKMAARLAELPADERRHDRSGYHAITYGWLVAELVWRVSGTGLAEFVQREIAEPLGCDGLYIGVPPTERARVAPLFPSPTSEEKSRTERVVRFLERFELTRPLVDALLVEDFDDLLFDSALPLAETDMAGVNGFFTARSLARMYGALANGGTYDGHRLVRPDTVADMARIQVDARDYVLFMPMKWRTGYHRAFVYGRRQPPQGFGHFGFGGSGAWCDPSCQLSVALTLNKISTTTPVADVRLARIGAAAWKAARRR